MYSPSPPSPPSQPGKKCKLNQRRSPPAQTQYIYYQFRDINERYIEFAENNYKDYPIIGYNAYNQSISRNNCQENGQEEIFTLESGNTRLQKDDLVKLLEANSYNLTLHRKIYNLMKENEGLEKDMNGENLHTRALTDEHDLNDLDVVILDHDDEHSIASCRIHSGTPLQNNWSLDPRDALTFLQNRLNFTLAFTEHITHRIR
ncbi:hypothetical protein B0J11DRAFT_512896 [Dendryphion nanum]|uniref:Uncharacterized protein n=1 Tax=Dendryphion nanum TaxID=256645 RepID=A0A9P9I7I3_9PLEO|nr:hypothetical protein B0J11DRAFT_512896 [Dendryphion nanum]